MFNVPKDFYSKLLETAFRDHTPFFHILDATVTARRAFLTYFHAKVFFFRLLLFVVVELSSTGLPLFHPEDMKIKYRKEIKIKFFLFFDFFFNQGSNNNTLVVYMHVTSNPFLYVYHINQEFLYSKNICVILF